MTYLCNRCGQQFETEQAANAKLGLLNHLWHTTVFQSGSTSKPCRTDQEQQQYETECAEQQDIAPSYHIDIW